MAISVATMCHMSARDDLSASEIGRRVLQARDATGLSQGQFAKAAHLSRAYISRLERGLVPNPTITDLAAVAGAARIPITTLVSPPSQEREIRITECADILSQLDGEPPEVADTILRWLRESIGIARAGRLARTN